MTAIDTAPPTAPPPAPLRLMTLRAEASRDIQNQVKIGQAIRNQRVRDQRDLDEARREKQEWVQRSTDLLVHLFNQPSIADQFNDFVATILPEYAEFSMFVDLFDDEMRHRLGRLHAILKGLRDVPEPPPVGAKEIVFSEAKVIAPASQAAAAPAPAPAPESTLATFLDSIAPPAAPKESARMTTMTPAPAQAAPSPTVARSVAQSAPSLPASISTGTLVLRVDDASARDAIASFLQRLGVKLQLTDRTSASTKPLFEDLNAQSSSAFALILTAPPDQQHNASDADALFDLGCCVGRLGPGRVIVMHRNGEPHVDRFGLTHVTIDASDGWQLQLAKHLRRAGVEVDLNKLV